MAGLSSQGIGSGLDVNSLVSKLMAVERLPITALDTKTTAVQAQISSYGTLKSTLATLQDAAYTLSQTSLYSAATATSSDSTVFTASTSSTAQAGSHSVAVTALASAQRLQSTGFASSATSIGTGSLTFEFGTWTGTSFANNPDKITKTVTIASGQDSVQGIANAVNAAKIGVTATVINDGSNS
ncbi:MAG: flagellar cap protein FliD N-terminal domain-containing protein, partial [Betaproteobacteria bacterium]